MSLFPMEIIIYYTNNSFDRAEKMFYNIIDKIKEKSTDTPTCGFTKNSISFLNDLFHVKMLYLNRTNLHYHPNFFFYPKEEAEQVDLIVKIDNNYYLSKEY